MMEKRNWKRVIVAIHMAMVAVLFCAVPAYASLDNIPLVEGTKKILNDLTPIVVAIGVLLTGVLAAVRVIQWNNADEQEKPRAKKQIISTVLGGILITTIVGTITAILGYYGS